MSHEHDLMYRQY